MGVLNGLVDDKILRILKLFLSKPDEFFHINKVSKESDVPLATAFRIINTLLENDLIEFQRISKFKIYRIKKSNKTRKLGRIL